ncbi:fumarylacetoacetate hydrolase family protein [Psychrosphaera sp. B3R10]|uniref:fumarylacetoacetate hydrolase family protein n=1 Tax=unclassified Psychrosphaera TaxID=2641570 RepID=UPI001C097FBB|nr:MULTISPECIES: fumarylacetoacetate hydrolase family protein [unclassified Psychrosphaera]MBU2883631.1 fumarylacetoacetate hydrolase family protein [Psychrosphaera sp. I2R16]MBU2989809.1 fumarylacetoacetate hydrolase family protein [Psychrosphaera sp. B3R10]
MSLNRITVAGTKNIPNKVVCVGRNFVDHIKELNNVVPDEMVLFIKPNSAISDSFVFKLGSAQSGDEIHFETEICFVVKNGFLDAVGVGLDLTKREIQTKLKQNGLPWERAKSFKGAAVLSPFVKLDFDLEKLHLKLWINGKLQQAGGVEHMIHSPTAILSEVETVFSLDDGDVIMTGTPKGVGKINQGDVFVAELFADEIKLMSQEWQA